MDRLALKIPLLFFFLGIVYFASKGTDAMDAVIRSFIFSFGIALIILVLTMLIVFFLTLQKERSDNTKLPASKESGKKVEMQV